MKNFSSESCERESYIIVIIIVIIMAKFIIGPREIKKAVKEGSVISVMAAKNCPKFLIEDIKKQGVDVKTFDGDQKELGTHIGKPFPVALVGQTK